MQENMQPFLFFISDFFAMMIPVALFQVAAKLSLTVPLGSKMRCFSQVCRIFGKRKEGDTQSVPIFLFERSCVYPNRRARFDPKLKKAVVKCERNTRVKRAAGGYANLAKEAQDQEVREARGQTVLSVTHEELPSPRELSLAVT